jgi:hypothetical protein
MISWIGKSFLLHEDDFWHYAAMLRQPASKSFQIRTTGPVAEADIYSIEAIRDWK